MVAQIYNDGNMRIFDRFNKMICEMEVTPALKSEADLQLKRLRLSRRGKWEDVSWGSDAKIRFS